MTNREQFISELKGKLNVTEAEAKRISDTVIDTIIDCTIKYGEVSFPQRVKFELAERKERTQTNPYTKEKITVPKKSVIKLKALKNVKSRLSTLN